MAIVSKIADDLKESESPDRKSVLLLGRYNTDILSSFADFDYYQFLKFLKNEYRELDLQYKTMHGSKGLEADYVIILDHGFPSEKVDDPILNLVLAEPELYPNAEERRLFYVALTRAKEKVFIATKSGDRSAFIDEIIKNPINFDVIGKELPHEPKCPKCREGRLVLRKEHAFWGCSNFARFECDQKVQACPFCKTGYPVQTASGELNCSVCEQEIVSCPEHGCDGFLQQRSSQTTGKFWGCTNFFNKQKSCKYTRNELHKVSTPQHERKEKPKSNPDYNLRSEDLKQKYARHGKPWASWERNELKQFIREGYTDEMISRKMGRSIKSIKMQRERMH